MREATQRRTTSREAGRGEMGPCSHDPASEESWSIRRLDRLDGVTMGAVGGVCTSALGGAWFDACAVRGAGLENRA
jgi:hypothetical protein